MSTQEKFTAAINVIRSLPKNGSYQPSKELLLKFYGYYKQATVGPNNQPKPSFWDVVNRAKWQAWDSLGNMSKEKAMEEYVNELKKIVETMAYTNPVADFVSSLDSFYESVSIDDLKVVVGSIEHGSLLERVNNSNINSLNEIQSITDADIDEECFHDVMEVNNSSIGEQKKINVYEENQHSMSNEYIENLVPDNHIPISQQNGTNMIELQTNEFLNEFQSQISSIIATMKYDLDVVINRVAQIEYKLNEIKEINKQKHRHMSKRSFYQMLILMGWPIIVQLIFYWFQKRKIQKSLKV